MGCDTVDGGETGLIYVSTLLPGVTSARETLDYISIMHACVCKVCSRRRQALFDTALRFSLRYVKCLQFIS